MHVIYFDDDQLSLDIVARALTTRGHHLSAINTGQAALMSQRFQQALSASAFPQVIILDGHNVARDHNGKVLTDLQPSAMLRWLSEHGLNNRANIRFILYSSDETLVQEAATNPEWSFAATVLKGGGNGGLVALMKAIEG